MKPIYLDNHATTQIDPRVLKEMLPYLTDSFGNPSSSHFYGWEAKEAVETAREQVASLINAEPEQIIFTSGATEANNMVLNSNDDCNIYISEIEHSSISWKRYDPWVKIINVNSNGVIDPETKLSIKEFNLISVMLANNEIGTIQPLQEISLTSLTKLHSDVAQAAGKIKVDIKELNLDYASLSAHKIYGPKGIGALYVKKDIKPMIFGGSQEFNLRAGTLNVSAIVGFGKACEIIDLEENIRISKLRDKLYSNLCNILGEELPRHGKNVLPGTLNIALPCDDMDKFMSLMADKVAFSRGSACDSTSTGGSRVLRAMNVPEDEISRSIRLCVGRFNTEEEIDATAEYMAEAIKGGKNA